MNTYSECEKTKTGQHEIQYPRLEDSIDKNVERTEPYCKGCFKRISEIEKESKNTNNRD